MDEEFENLSISSSDEWAILDENSENKHQGTTDKFCCICGVELDQLVYKRECCPFCPVCYSCYQNYPSSKFKLNCEHKEKPFCAQDLQQTSPRSADSSLSENYLLICRPPPETNDSEQTEVHDGSMVENNANGHTKILDEEEKDSPTQNAASQMSSNPRLNPFLDDFEELPSGAATALRRRSLSWSDCDGPVSGSSVDGDLHEEEEGEKEEEQVVPRTTASLEPAAAASASAGAGSGSKPAYDLTTRLAGFEMASASSAAPYDYVRCAPRPMTTISCAGRPAAGGGSPPTATNFFALSSPGVRSRSPPLSSPSPSIHSSTQSGSAMNSAARFLKSIVEHSATTLNNFDVMPMEPWSGILPETGSSSSSSSSSSSANPGALSPVSGLSTEEPRLQERPTQPSTVSSTRMAARPQMMLVKKHTLDDDKLRALVTPKAVAKCIFEASAYNLR